MTRFTLNAKSTPETLARDLRSLAAKIDASALTPGNDITVGNIRVQVAVPQESPIRAFARANGFAVGTRGRYSKALQDAYAAHVKAEKVAKAEARKAAREAKAALIDA